MTQASRLPKRGRLQNNKSSSRKNPSVTFETQTRYLRKGGDGIDSSSKVLPFAKTRLTYVAPDATVILSPSAIERAALTELSKSVSKEEKKKVNITHLIKKTVHKESETYDEYGVQTREIYTEEIDLDVGIGATVASRQSQDDVIFKSKENTGSFKVIREELETKFRKFAGMVYRLRIG